MKKALLAIVLAASTFGASAATHFIVGGFGEIMIGEDGTRAGIWNSADKSGTYFQSVTEVQHIDGCDVGIYQNEGDKKDLLTITFCEKLKPMVKFGRYYDGEKKGGWLVDTSRYMYFDKKDK